MKAVLDVIVPFNNPMRWQSRIANFRRFEDAMTATPGVRLMTVELAYGDRPFELPDHLGVHRVRVRGTDVLWHKENLLNIGAAALPGDSRYIAVIDGDLLFFDPLWALETVQALQLRPIVQISSDLVFLGPRSQHLGRGVSFMSLFQDARRRHHCGKYYHPGTPVTLDRHGYPGGAWAWRRETWHAVAGMLDTCILGAGDMHMALGLVGMADPLLADRDYQLGYQNSIGDWRGRAWSASNGHVGLVPGLVFHLWHGSTEKRQYSTRGQILIRNRFDPGLDLVRDHQGLLKFAGNKPRLRDDIAAYFAERDEDD